MDPLLIQHHIPKTAGTSIRQVTRANYEPSELVGIDWWTEPFRSLVAREATEVRDREGIRWDKLDVGRERLVEVARSYYQSLPQPERVRCFMGHLAGLLLPVVSDRPVRGACMLRDPVDRAISLVRWAEWSAADRRDEHGEFNLVVRAMRERRWTLKDVYSEVAGSGTPPPELAVPFGRLFNGQARHLLAGPGDSKELPFSARSDDLAGARERVLELLNDRYVVGTQDRFPQSLRLFADTFGWRHVFLPKARAGPGRDQSTEIDEETRALIRAHNTLDAELHAHFSDRLRESPSVAVASRLRGSVYYQARRGRRGLRKQKRTLSRRLRLLADKQA